MEDRSGEETEVVQSKRLTLEECGLEVSKFPNTKAFMDAYYEQFGEKVPLTFTDEHGVEKTHMVRAIRSDCIMTCPLLPSTLFN